MNDSIFQRTEILLGTQVMSHIARQNVIIFGVGGVGSWCAEGLVRSGISHLTIVDNDCVCLSNVNRQMMATTKTVGRPKVEALKERLLEINPSAEITALQKLYSAETAADFHLENFDYIIDAIDSIEQKCNLILHATSLNSSPLNTRFFSSMGAALKLNPLAIQVTEFWKVKGCPLARALRKRFKRMQKFPSRKFQCVFSEEHQQNQQPDKANGTVLHVTGTFGFILSGLVIQDILHKARPSAANGR
ncbi:MAG: tRNA threonylcarbamoyladenosine dehydratase [Bacteroidaceae bacterium]|nr:tRNA threonylcarbamoyladenosine dehydratase [Bacteroidaceae bacterium]